MKELIKNKILAWSNQFFKCVFQFSLKVIGLKRLLELVVDIAQGKDNFLTYHYRPKQAVSVSTQSDGLEKSRSLAIVIQGPIVLQDNLTLETVKIYQRHFAGSKIILSTWKDESATVIKQFEDLGITVILNEKPAYAGVSNINMQIVTTQSGICKAKETGVQYALKTRTDQRMYAPNLADFFYNITQTFPVKGHWPKQKKRIVGCNFNTFKYRMYGLSDMLIYGDIDDMLLYFDIGLTEGRAFFEGQKMQERDLINRFAQVCEVFLSTGFLGKIGREPQWSVQDSWDVFADHFCVVDKEQLDLYWPKYVHGEQRWLKYQENYLYQEMTFRDWLNIYAGVNKRIIKNDVLNALEDIIS